MTTPSGEVEALNQPTLEYFGKTFEELKGWQASDIVHPDDLQHTITAQQRPTKPAVRTTLRAGTAALMASTAGSTSWVCPCETRKDTSSAGSTCKSISMTGSRLKKRYDRANAILTRSSTRFPRWHGRLVPTGPPIFSTTLSRIHRPQRHRQRMGWTGAVHPTTQRAVAAWQSIMLLQPGETSALRARREQRCFCSVLTRCAMNRHGVNWYGNNMISTTKSVVEHAGQAGLARTRAKSARAMAFDWYSKNINVWSPQQESLQGIEPAVSTNFPGRNRTLYPQTGR